MPGPPGQTSQQEEKNMRRLSIIWLLPLVFTVCKSPYELVRTGPEHPALPKEAEVQLVPWSDMGSYDQLAIVDVGEFTLEKRIKYAKDAARAAGGEYIAARLTGDPAKDNRTEYLVQSFVVLKKKAPGEQSIAAMEMPKVSDGAAPKEDIAPEPEGGDLDAGDAKADYSKLPRASYRMLLSDTPSLKGEQFRGSLYPVKYFRVPPALKTVAGSGNQLLMLSSRKGSARVLLVVPREKRRDILSRINAKKPMEFVYKPVTVYRSKYPVLQFVDEIR